MTENPDFPTVPDLLEVGRLAALGRLTPGALHEVANPLVALLGTAELLLEDAERGTKTADRLQLVVDTAREISGIVRALQGYSRERLAPRGPVALERLVGETVELVRRTSGVRDVALEETRSEVEVSVDGAPGELKQAVLTLILNALEAQSGGGKVAVTTGTEDGGAVVTITGGRGSGLGLDACAAIVQGHGGVLDETNGGSAFVLRLPLRRDE
jgi:two-component system sensor histidine kinase PilS (NtrC family)